jgi:hypothetical protein
MITVVSTEVTVLGRGIKLPTFSLQVCFSSCQSLYIREFAFVVAACSG